MLFFDFVRAASTGAGIILPDVIVNIIPKNLFYCNVKKLLKRFMMLLKSPFCRFYSGSPS